MLMYKAIGFHLVNSWIIWRKLCHAEIYQGRTLPPNPANNRSTAFRSSRPAHITPKKSTNEPTATRSGGRGRMPFIGEIIPFTIAIVAVALLRRSQIFVWRIKSPNGCGNLDASSVYIHPPNYGDPGYHPNIYSNGGSLPHCTNRHRNDNAIRHPADANRNGKRFRNAFGDTRSSDTLCV